MEVEFVVVELMPVKFCRVVEPVARICGEVRTVPSKVKPEVSVRPVPPEFV